MKNSAKTISVVILGVLIFFFLAWYFSNIFFYFVISMVLATIMRPLTNYLSKQQIFNFRVPRAMAILLSFSLLILLISIFITLFLPLVYDQVQILSVVNLDSLVVRLNTPVLWIENNLLRYNLGNYNEGFLMEGLKKSLSKLIYEIDITAIIENLLFFTGNFFIGLMAVVFITFFLLFEKGLVRKLIIRLIPNEYFEVTIAGLYKVEKLLSNYLLGLLFQMTAIFTISFAGLSFVGIKYAASISLFAAVINLIPYMGPLLGSIFAVVIGFSTAGLQVFDSNEYIILAVKILTVFGIMKLIDDMVLQPLIFSKSVKAHPLEIFIIIFAGATLAGAVGMIIAIPAYTIIRVFSMEALKAYKSYQIFKI
ncbi:MAG: AI-2E family transporter [Cyclobacteriaceae bacterium]|nr:AI-2E family transporter [Cyclobacteriaceae bacterium]